MSQRPPPKRDNQPDLFAANFADIPIRDQRDTMERPFFSLAKQATLHAPHRISMSAMSGLKSVPTRNSTSQLFGTPTF